VKGDIEYYFPNADVTETPKGDYRYRTTLPRVEVADRIRQALSTFAAITLSHRSRINVVRRFTFQFGIPATWCRKS